MLAIRMQRTGRKGHAMFRVVVQDSRRTPSSGKVVALLGSYDPHQKTVTLDKEKAAFYLEHGAQPSDRSARLLKNEGIAMPSWVKVEADKVRVVRHADKRRSTQPPAPVEEVAKEPAAEVPAPDVVTEEATAPAVEETKVEAAEAETTPAEEEKA
jgi:small subunit ribosomal protein S16